MQKFGIDISKWQGNFNFAEAKKQGVEFVIIKAGGGDSVLYQDSKFERNYTEAKKNNIPVGAYFFGYAKTESDARKEADYFLSLLKGKQFEMPVYYDVEHTTQKKLGKAKLTAVVNAFCDKVEKSGYYTGVYTYVSFYNNYLDVSVLNRYTHWIASYTKTQPVIRGKAIDMWQFGGETNFIRSNTIAGVVCDQNYCYVDFTETIKKNGLNGFGKMPELIPEPTPTRIDTSKYPVLKKGSRGEYVLLLQKRLVELGYDPKGLDGIFGNGCMGAVKAFQKTHYDINNKKLVVDGCVGPKTWDSLMN